MVVRAWVSGSVDYDGESWQGFRARIRRALDETIAHASGQQSAVVFTSATPAAIAAGEALGLDEAGIFQLAGALLNASCTELRWRRGAWRLFSFNNVPHLPDRSLHTHR
jgi:broad specificity phosphatase PhoE